LKANAIRAQVPANEQATDASIHLDAVRGLAALWVLLGHSRGLYIAGGVTALLRSGQQSAPKAVYQANQNIALDHFRLTELITTHVNISRLAVIAFFVLSGYLVGGSVLKSERKRAFSWSRYLLQRMTRLWTVLIPALMLCALLDGCGMYLLHSTDNIYRASPFIAPVIHNCYTVKAFFGSAFFLQGILTPSFGTDNPLWSLSYEFWFYLFFPLLVGALARSRPARGRTCSAALLLVLMALCGWSISAYFLIWLLGAGLALMPLAIPARLRSASLAAAFILLGLTVFVDLRLIVNRFLSEFAAGVACTFLLWVLLHAQGHRAHPLYRIAAQRLSGMSYTLYLTHYPALVLFSAVLMPQWRLWPFTPASLLKLVPVVALVFAISGMMYYCFERNTPRVRAWLPSEWRWRSPREARS
jgi:peptidoglycan/LPS O-acetylase OafA/YrhL